ncbi:carboxylic acid reductase [Mycobacterium montefiorense]|uniref:Carboxylic acid reductase n=1 Tax=Mycobacterium montefiorense TaxID=154654 RepID=A0AA37PNY0_9MYCO|nr:carboxylic acid reductase [Mycobacterium montefiorense]GBG37831.1 oxidoreductase [Mycobacterium montefiorense]GKU34969.1 oxidoreductase [Mycobacterium montefiorense]GKU40982.1 oxidoreductase [Mycobacterium montefiorense]GKU47091.1 oxidoreductase [Mycobacterium montefiorense]GKU56802.1 oxidoreductase [Mycobacterium montefiorense]
MSVDARREIGTSAGSQATPRQRVAERILRLEAADDQYQNAKPDPALQAAARQPGLRLPQILKMFADGYADRPALGWRARELAADPVTGRTTSRLLHRFDTISYRDLWANVAAVATAWRHDSINPVKPGDVVATLGFASPEYLTVDLVTGYLGLVAVPLQHNASASRLQPIVAEIEPQVLATGAGYLDLAVEAALGSTSLRRLVVFDYEPEIDDLRENLERAQAKLADAGMAVTIETFDELVERGLALPPEPWYTGESDERLAMIMYTSGSTGLPKGAMYTERMILSLWTTELYPEFADIPVLNVNFMPLNHVGGRIPLASSFQAGGTSYFVPESDLSTLFDDWNLVRPTEMGMVPRVVEMLYQRYQSAVERLVGQGAEPAEADTQAKAALREQVLGGRVITSFSTTAPLAAEMKIFIESCLDVHVLDGYGLTEVGMVFKDGLVSRPPVTDYKLIDVPELGYFHTDKPYPRGELLVKSQTAFGGYFKRPDVTANAFDPDGYYRTGDVMAEIGPDRLVYVDRRNNVLKLAQGEFVAVARLEAVFSSAALVRQIFVYGNSERPYLLAVVVPTAGAEERFAGDPDSLKAALSESLRRTAKLAELQSYEVPADFLIESEPFNEDNGLLSGVGKLLRPKLKEHYGVRLEELYAELAATRTAELRALREGAANRPVIDTLTRAAEALLGLPGGPPDPDTQFLDLGGDSLSALTFSNLLQDIFDVEVPVGQIISPASDLRQLAEYVESERESGSKRPTFSTVHGRGVTEVHASDLTLDKFIDAKTLAAAPALPRATGTPQTVLLTGANGYLGRFLTLEWLERLAETGGKLVTIIRGTDTAAASKRLEAVFDSGDPQLLQRFRSLAADHLEVILGDIAEPNLGLDQATWDRLAQSVDMIVHPAAFVNHVLPYDQLFGPNVVGTAELIRLAITTRIKPVTYLSTVSVAMSVDPAKFLEDGDIRTVSPVRPIDDSYANGYGNSKWGGEVLLREAHDLCGLPVAVFRSDLILAHSRYAGQLNVPDMFTRLIFSLLVTGIAPSSFYEADAKGHRAVAHFDGLPADFVAAAVTTLGEQTATAAEDSVSYRSFDVMNPHDDGISLDVFVDWLIAAGHAIQRIDDYGEWLQRFETTIRALPEKQRQQSVLPLLEAYRKPEAPLRGAPAPTDVFRAAVQEAKIGADEDIPHLSEALIEKYISDLRLLGLI